MSWLLFLVVLGVGEPEVVPPSPSMFGSVSSVDSTTARFELKSGAGKFDVGLADDCRLEALKRSTLGEVPMDATVHVLGQLKEINWGSGTTTELMKVQVMVTADDYAPPPVPAALAKDGYAWHSGKLAHEAAQNKFFISGIWVHVNKESVAYIGGGIPRDKLFDHLAKKSIVWIAAKVLEGDAVEAQKLVVVEGRVPKAELVLLFDPGDKKKRKR